MGNWAEEACAPALAKYEQDVKQNTWGHLAPKRNTTYRGYILISASGYGQQGGLIDMEWDNMEDSPWLYDVINEWLSKLELEKGCVYMIQATMRNWRFWGKPIKLHSIRTWKEFMHK